MNLTKEILINMPQMALEALSENWLFKELGDTHWELICNGLNTKSFDLKNEVGDRLYATFVRIRIVCSKNLKAFKENENANVEGSISRFGNSMYFSKIKLSTEEEFVQGELMTTFSIRSATDNTKLSKSEPFDCINHIENLKALPQIGNEYRLLKKTILKKLEFGEYTFYITDAEPIFETRYTLNPYYDLNGVNLLYFAAYPVINDFCEAKYFNQQIDSRWEQNFYTKYKDVFYYANCNIEDDIIYKLNSVEKIDENSYKISSTLIRSSDQAILARIFTVKSR